MPIIWVYEVSPVDFYVHRGKNLLRTAMEEGSLSGWKYVGSLTGFTNFSAEMELTRAEPDGAANRSQPVGSETNQTSPAAASRRSPDR
jgi:hypothetical protein